MAIDFDAIKHHAAQGPVSAYQRAGWPAEKLRKIAKGWQGVCPLHADADPSFTVFEDGGFQCFGCGQRGDILDFHQALHRYQDTARAAEELSNLFAIAPGRTPSPAPTPTARKPEPDISRPKPIPPEQVNAWVQALQDRPELLAWLNAHRGYEPGLIEFARIGLDVEKARITIPVFDGDTCRDVRGWRIPDEVAIANGLTPDEDTSTMKGPAKKPDGSSRPRLYDPGCHITAGHGPLFLAEGEWDCLRMIQDGHAAFTVTCGATKWPDGRSVNPPPDLSGRTVYIIGDNDQAGDKHNETGAVNCYLAGAEEVYSVPWPEGTPEKGDVSDWLNAGRTLEELLVGASRVPKPRVVVPYKRRWTGLELANTDFPEPVWIVPRIIPEGTTLLAGRPKLGKSWLALQIAHAKAIGGVALGERVEAGRVLFCALEDNARRLKDRMDGQHWPAAAQAAADFVLEITLEELETLLSAETFDLAIIDTFSKLVNASGYNHNDQGEMTAAWGRIHALGIRTGTSLLVLEHHNKGFTGDPVQDIIGSTAKAAVVDCVAGLYRERGQVKATLAITGRDVEERSLELRFEPADLAWFPVEELPGGVDHKHAPEILAVLEAGPNSISGISRALGGLSKNGIRLTLAALSDRGRVRLTTGDLWELCDAV